MCMSLCVCGYVCACVWVFVRVCVCACVCLCVCACVWVQLQERLRKIGEVGGLKELGVLDEGALDDDWDPEKHEVGSCVG